MHWLGLLVTARILHWMGRWWRLTGKVNITRVLLLVEVGIPVSPVLLVYYNPLVSH